MWFVLEEIVRLIVKKELSGPSSPNINVGYEFEGLWTSPDLCCNIDMGEKGGEGGNWLVSRIFAPDCRFSRSGKLRSNVKS